MFSEVPRVMAEIFLVCVVQHDLTSQVPEIAILDVQLYLHQGI